MKIKIQHHPNDNVTVTIPKHKRTITITKALAKRCNLPTNKLFVEFPKFNIDLKDFGIIQPLIYNDIWTKVLNKKEYFVIFKNTYFCLGKEYKGPITHKKINQIIERFFNSKFNYLQANFLKKKEFK